jgi:hypothetical protein
MSPTLQAKPATKKNQESIEKATKLTEVVYNSWT